MGCRCFEDLYLQRTTNFKFAWDLMLKAQVNFKKLELGEKVFIIQATREALMIPGQYRSEGFDDMLGKLLSWGVCDYTHIPPGIDRVVDYFYMNPHEVSDSFKRM